MTLQRNKRRAQPKKRHALKHEVASRPFTELLWPVPRVLAWIAFREIACVEEDWRAATEQPTWPVRDTDPQGTLLRALQGNSIRALKDGKELAPEAWANAAGHNWPDDVQFRREDVLALWPAHRERLLAMARDSGTFEPVAQRNIVTEVIRQSLWSRTCTPVEILRAAYGDPEGRWYWELWLFEPLGVYQFADLLAVHRAATEGAPTVSILGGSMPVLDGYLQQIFDRLRAAAEARETWFVGDTSSLLTETWTPFALRSSALAVRPREAVAWLLRNPNARHLVPTTLAGMESSAVHAILPPAVPASDKTPDPTETPTTSTAAPAGDSTDVGPIRNKPGTGGVKKDAAIAAMVNAVEEGKISIIGLRQMKQKLLVELYPGAKRTLLAEARREALKRIEANRPTDKTPT
jgi:hypothetical protein